jgi:RHS repeat-associated protein
VAWEKGLPTPTASASYAYDPFGRRIRKVANGTTTWFVWDGDVLAAEFDGSGSRTRRYTYDGGWAPAELVVNGTSETAYAVTTDHLDTPRMLTNGAGDAVWRSSHESFGQAVVDEDVDGDTNLVSFSIRFPGQYEDVETGLRYNRNRFYSPSIGRYISADPIGLEGSANAYLYVDGQPVDELDPSGLAKHEPDSEYCKSLKRRIANIYDQLQKRDADIRNNPQGLPQRIGPGERLRDTVRGHRTIVNRLNRQVRNLEKKYENDCGPDDPPCGVCPDPATVGIAAGSAVAGYAAYRCVRLIPSFAPPLWWTLPVNLATP